MILAAKAWPSTRQQSPSDPTALKPKVEIVQTVGCVERRGTGTSQWWLAYAAPPTAAREGVFTTRDLDAAREIPRGNQAFRLIGEAEYLDHQGLLRTQKRSEFTTPEQVNATGGLREGRTVVVKGLLITGNEERINLLAVAPLADTCR
jgi:hypothetical protein